MGEGEGCSLDRKDQERERGGRGEGMGEGELNERRSRRELKRCAETADRQPGRKRKREVEGQADRQQREREQDGNGKKERRNGELVRGAGVSRRTPRHSSAARSPRGEGNMLGKELGILKKRMNERNAKKEGKREDLEGLAHGRRRKSCFAWNQKSQITDGN